jgi:hypothetical protein
MKPASLKSSAGFYCFVSALSVCGSVTGWRLWFTFGGWQRQQHWGEETLWLLSASIGLWAAVNTIRFAYPNRSAIAMVGVCFIIFHLWALLFVLEFIGWLRSGGPPY